ncbi:hypothetical protein [Luteimonas kalidii]|uniref:AsmA family protein n=1 Tax=Luteimonas kalidii TaxID=3042025 RepID=A0ABT6JY27_9GAMM|nr:hypothetical protein [Luteimonas kalidii]MDH5835615.1 hypothetical protein [Luteimonas kalidii]
MNAGRAQAATPRARPRWARIALALCAVPLALGLLLWLVLALAFPPERIVPLVLARVGASIGLEISADGDAASRFGARPSFVVRNLVAREPGAARPLLQARRVLVALPWRTIRALGDPLELARVELDGAVLDLPALQHWLATRPPGAGRLPIVSDGLQVTGGRIDGDGWHVEALRLALPRLHPERPLRAQVSGRYVDASRRAPFALAASLVRPASGRGFALAGPVAPEGDGWRVPAWILLSGALHWEDGLRLLPARFGASARLFAGDTVAPFALGLHAPLRSHAGAWTLVPAGIALRGEGLVPSLDARGRIAYGQRLLFEAEGRIARWPSEWPTLPPPLGASRVPLDLALAYRGAPDLSAPLSLRAARDDLRFDGRLDVPALVAWGTAPTRDSPLPPLQGRLQAARIEVSGAELEGVVLEFEDDPPATAAPAP